MHVTILNARLQTHKSYTYPAEELVLLRKENVEFLIENKTYNATIDDLIFVDSNVLYTWNNVDDEVVEYYAFQLE